MTATDVTVAACVNCRKPQHEHSAVNLSDGGYVSAAVLICPVSTFSPSGVSRLSDDHIGLSLDMLDADRLRQWADNIEVHGGDVTYWASMLFLVTKLREMADNVEQAVRDIGMLRERQSK